MTDRSELIRARNALFVYRAIAFLLALIAAVAFLRGYLEAALICLGFAVVVGVLRGISAQIAGMRYPELRDEPPVTLGDAERTRRHGEHLD